MISPKLVQLLLLLSLSSTLIGQNTIGLPEINNYTRQRYNAGSQNWDICQGNNGIVYFGNNEGLLSFDGTFWKLLPLPNRTIVRAVEKGQNERIYVGGQNELGYFSPNTRGILTYHSLVELIPASDRSFDDVWNICNYGNDIFFRTNKRIFQLTDNKITVYPTRSEWRFIGLSNGMLIAEDQESGLFIFQNGSWLPFLRNSLFPATALVTSFIALDKNRSLIATLKDGIFLVEGEMLVRINSPDLQAKKIIYKAVRVGDNRIALATSYDGCQIIEENGTLVQSLTPNEGLQNNNIRSIFLDRNNNLWLGLDNGIDFVAFNNSIKHIDPQTPNIGSGYSARLFANQLYLGTSNGLYRVATDGTQNFSFIKKELQRLPGTEGEAWNLSVVDNKLLMGHHNGAFLIEGPNASMLDNSSGYWIFNPVSTVFPSSLMVAGNYLGLNFFSFANGNFSKTNIEARFESARFVVVENDKTMWVAHPYKGIYRITLDANNKPSIKLYNQSLGLFSANNNYIFRIKNRIVATTENGLYEYNEKNDRFEISTYFKNILDEKNIRYLKEDSLGNIWYVRDKELSVLDYSSDKPVVIHFPELNNKLISGFENVYPFDENNIIVGGEKGFYHVDLASYKKNRTALETSLRLVRVMGKEDSLIYGGYQKPEKLTVPYSMNSIHFEYSAIMYSQQSNIEYSYRLKGFDNSWSHWSPRPDKEFTNLPAGSYVFEIKSRSNLGNESAVSEYPFSVMPPWYQTVIAYIIYSLMAIALIIYVQIRQRKKFASQRALYEKEQQQLRYLHQLEIEQSEKEIVKLNNEKLEAEIGHKNSQLATSAMHLVQKREMLGKIKDDLNSLLKKVDNEQVSAEFKKLVKMLVDDDKTDDNWEHFAHHFDKVHTDFLVELKNRYAALTPSELKLCAYLRMNLSNKEIAQLTNISTRGVEIARYRLRKKLGLSTETNLFEFLMKQGGEMGKVNSK